MRALRPGVLVLITSFAVTAEAQGPVANEKGSVQIVAGKSYAYPGSFARTSLTLSVSGALPEMDAAGKPKLDSKQKPVLRPATRSWSVSFTGDNAVSVTGTDTVAGNFRFPNVAPTDRPIEVTVTGAVPSRAILPFSELRETKLVVTYPDPTPRNRLAMRSEQTKWEAGDAKSGGTFTFYQFGPTDPRTPIRSVTVTVNDDKIVVAVVGGKDRSLITPKVNAVTQVFQSQSLSVAW